MLELCTNREASSSSHRSLTMLMVTQLPPHHTYLPPPPPPPPSIYTNLLPPHPSHLDMLNDHSRLTPPTTTSAAEHEEEAYDDIPEVRDIHPLTEPPSHPSRGRRRDLSEGGSLSLRTDSDNFTTMSREFNAMVVAGSDMINGITTTNSSGGNAADDVIAQNNQLARIGEEALEETNPLAIVPDTNPNPIPSPRRLSSGGGSSADSAGGAEPVHLVKKEEVESKVSAWQTAEVAKINNRFKREEVIINGWESEQVERATAWLKKVERKLDEQRARAIEKMQNDVARAHQKAAEKKASAEAKRGTKVARVLELANFMRAVGRAPSKRSFF